MCEYISCHGRWVQQTEPDENKRGFKPGWKSVRPMAKIDPHRPSYEMEDRRVRLPPTRPLSSPLAPSPTDQSRLSTRTRVQEERAEKHMPNRRQYLNARYAPGIDSSCAPWAPGLGVHCVLTLEHTCVLHVLQ